jgi:hypothetical protein
MAASLQESNNSLDGAGLGDRTRMERGQTLPVLDFALSKSNAGKMLTQ